MAEKIVFVVGSASIFDENNPLSYEERRKMLEKVLKYEGLSDRVIKIVPLEDYFDNEKWLKKLIEAAGPFDIVISNNDWVNSIVENGGYKTLREPYYKRNLYEGWRIRKLIRTSLSSRARPKAESRDFEWQNRVPKYLISNLKFQVSNQFLISNKQIFKHVVVGGTFDHFHAGHEELLKKAFEIGKKVTIGVATEELYKSKLLANIIEPFSTRKKSVSEFLKNKNWSKRANTIAFSEFTGGAAEKKNVDAIVVSRLTYPNALKINEIREKNHLKPLRITIIKDVLAEDGRLISSERIRIGEIDRKGKLYNLIASHQSLATNHYLTMPESLRGKLRKPLGKVFSEVHQVLKFIGLFKPVMVIAVGDIIVNSLIKNDAEPDIKVIDFRSRRKDVKEDSLNTKTVFKRRASFVNKPGTINLKTAEKLRESIKNVMVNPTNHDRHHWFVVDGEEDLLTLPAILYAPLGSLVLYGHWQLGIVAVEVTEKRKTMISKVLRKFT